jgi:hypothetical protein
MEWMLTWWHSPETCWEHSQGSSNVSENINIKHFILFLFCPPSFFSSIYCQQKTHTQQPSNPAHMYVHVDTNKYGFQFVKAENDRSGMSFLLNCSRCVGMCVWWSIHPSILEDTCISFFVTHFLYLAHLLETNVPHTQTHVSWWQPSQEHLSI